MSFELKDKLETQKDKCLNLKDFGMVTIRCTLRT